LTSAKAFGIKVERVILGADLLMIKTKKLSISPFLISGEVETTVEELDKHEFYKVALYFISGGLANVLYVIVGLLFIHTITGKLLLLINIPIAFATLTPILKQSDMRQVMFYKRRLSDVA
jgi:hypothetical protein